MLSFLIHLIKTNSKSFIGWFILNTARKAARRVPYSSWPISICSVTFEPIFNSRVIVWEEASRILYNFFLIMYMETKSKKKLTFLWCTLTCTENNGEASPQLQTPLTFGDVVLEGCMNVLKRCRLGGVWKSLIQNSGSPISILPIKDRQSFLKNGTWENKKDLSFH